MVRIKKIKVYKGKVLFLKKFNFFLNDNYVNTWVLSEKNSN